MRTHSVMPSGHSISHSPDTKADDSGLAHFPHETVANGGSVPERLKVLVSASTFPATLNDGTPRFIHDLATAMSEHAEVTVLVPDRTDAQKQETTGRLRVCRFSYFWPRNLQRLTPQQGAGMRENFRDSWLAKIQLPFFLLRQIGATRSLIKRRKIDVVNAHWIIPQGFTAAIALTGLTRTRLVLHVHAGDVYLLRKLPLGRCIARFVLKRTDAVFADGSHVRDTLDELLGRTSHAVLQPMGVDTSVFGKVSGELPIDETRFTEGFLLSIGRFVEKKGMVHLIRSLPRILQEFPNLGLVLVGQGPEESALKSEIEQLALQSSVLFAGQRSHQEIARLLQSCRLSVVPSVIDSNGETEGMPTVVVEAMAAGVPVVGSRVDGIPDVIRDGENGWLCREKDHHDLAEKILIALNADHSRFELAASQTGQNYDWQRVAATYIERMRAVSEGC